MAVEDDEGRPPFCVLKCLQSFLNSLDVIGVSDTQDVPAITEESRRNVLGESEASVSLDGDVVVVIAPTKVIEAPMPRQRRGFGGDALHQTAVAADGVNAVVENIEPRLVVSLGQPFFGDGHADARGDALP